MLYFKFVGVYLIYDLHLYSPYSFPDYIMCAGWLLLWVLWNSSLSDIRRFSAFCVAKIASTSKTRVLLFEILVSLFHSHIYSSTSSLSYAPASL